MSDICFQLFLKSKLSELSNPVDSTSRICLKLVYYHRFPLTALKLTIVAKYSHYDQKMGGIPILQIISHHCQFLGKQYTLNRRNITFFKIQEAKLLFTEELTQKSIGRNLNYFKYCEILKVNGKYIEKSSGFPQNHLENVMKKCKR